MTTLQLPKVVLHDHLDGALRPETIVELADAVGYRGLPETEPRSLAEFFDQGSAGSLEAYLQAFDHTVAVMQTRASIRRVARELGEDMASENVVYGEVRFAPRLCTAGGLSMGDVIEAALDGLRAAEERHGTHLRLITVAMRHEPGSAEVAAVATRYREDGVVGFDIAGPERGQPAQQHADAFTVARNGGLGITIHAGEASGPESVADAMNLRADRIGHGVRIIDDCEVVAGQITGLGPIARALHDAGTPLEVCPTSNVHTIGWAPSEHPVGMLHRAGFEVTVSPDNRLMSATSQTSEFELLLEHQAFTLGDLEAVTLNAVNASFCDEELRNRLESAVRDGYKEALTKSTMS